MPSSRPILLAAVLYVAAGFGFSSDQTAEVAHTAAYQSMERKITHLEQNAAKPRPDPGPTEITEDEANAYLNEGGVKLPKGVSQVHLAAQGGTLDGMAKVDFDTVIESKRSANPLLGLFSGMHDVRIVALADGAGGTGNVKVQSVYLDGMEVPPLALELFAERYITPKYPGVGVSSTFKLPLRIDSAVVESGKVRLAQK